MNYLCIRFREILAIGLCSFFGLSPLHARAQSTDHGFLGSSVTAEQVSNVVKKGVSREAVIKAFGEPAFNLEREEIYPMEGPKHLADFKEGFAGFEVRYLSNRVESWSPIESSSIVITNNTPLGSLTGTNIAEIAFHVVYDEVGPIPGYRYIDTPSFPHLGSIKNNADLVAHGLAHVELTEANLFPSGKEYDITIRLPDSQTNAFAKLTTQRFVKRLLVMIDNEPIAAPFMLTPIKDGRFSISFRDRKEAEEMMKKLTKSHTTAP